MWRNRNPFLWWECGLVQPIWKTVCRFLKKLKMELTCNPVILLLSIHLKKPKTLIQKDISTPTFTVALFIIAKIWKQLKCPSTDEWIKKWWYIYTLEYYSTIKEGESLSFVTAWINLETEAAFKWLSPLRVSPS